MKSLKNKLTTPIVNLVLCLSFTTSTVMALEHRELMWGVKNKGEKILIDIDPLQRYRIQGVAGEDLRLLPPVKGRKVKVAVVDTGVDITHKDLTKYIYKNQPKCEAYSKFMACVNASPQDDEVKPTQIKNKSQKDKKNKDAPEETEIKPHILQCREKFLTAEENVYPADCFGWSILDTDLSFEGVAQTTPNNIIGRPDFLDPAGHGTHVAGAIVAVTENVEIIPVQVIGEGPNQPVKPFQVDLSPSENERGGFQSATDLSERVARGIIYAINAGAEVINLSLGWPGDPMQNSAIIREAILEAQRRNIIVVAAAGNDSTDAILRPCQYRNVICVAASRPDGALANFSNFGMGVDIAAPGVEILSTIPEHMSSVGLPGFKGYDYLSGTSQATPYVSGVIADMLSRGVPPADIYPRLILGARPVKPETAVIKGPGQGTLVRPNAAYKKTVLSGLLDMQGAMSPTLVPQPLILPADKDIQVIQWDRKSANLSFQFKLKNFWKDLSGKSVSIQLRSTMMSEIEPAIVGANFVGGSANSWKNNEERTVKVDLQIRDNQNPSLSRIQRELSYQVYVLIDGKTHRQFEVKADVVAPITKDFTDPDVQTIPLVEGNQPGMSLTPVEEIYDHDQLNRDYFLLGLDESDEASFNIALVKMINGQYEAQPTQNVKFEGDISQWRPRYKIRMDIDGDGVSEYVLGIIEYLDAELGMNGPYRNHFYVFDRNMKLKRSYLFDDKRMALPYAFNWMKVGNSMRPAWVAQGPEIKKKYDVTDLWSVDSIEDVPTKRDIRLFYLDENFKLTHAESSSNQRIADVIQPTLAQVKAGILPVLLAKNIGPELKPSYVNRFSIGEVMNGKIIREKALDAFNTEITYRNLVDTLKDKSFSTNMDATEFRGTMWYGPYAHKTQRVTLLDLETSKIYDKIIGAQREVFDAALQIRAGFQSPGRSGVFLITNTEIEYHDLLNFQVATRSLNRFTFYDDSFFIEFHNPITIIDRANPGYKLPALYTTEGSGLNFAIKIMVPVYTNKGILSKMVMPARLSLKAGQGCKALPTPLFMGEKSGYALDYNCGDRIKRVLLKY